MRHAPERHDIGIGIGNLVDGERRGRQRRIDIAGDQGARRSRPGFRIFELDVETVLLEETLLDRDVADDGREDRRRTGDDAETELLGLGCGGTASQQRRADQGEGPSDQHSADHHFLRILFCSFDPRHCAGGWPIDQQPPASAVGHFASAAILRDAARSARLLRMRAGASRPSDLILRRRAARRLEGTHPELPTGVVDPLRMKRSMWRCRRRGHRRSFLIRSVAQRGVSKRPHPEERRAATRLEGCSRNR